MKLLCVDEDTSEKVGQAIRKLRPGWDIVHARQWAGGGTPDDLLLEILWQARRALISRDRSTLPGWIKQRQARSLNHAGVFFWDAESFPPNAIGALARASIRTIERYDDTTNIVDTIR